MSALRCAPLLGLLAACAPDAGGFAHSTAAIAGGQSDATHTAVVAIAVQLGAGTTLCSGSLIAPNLVLTARHCVSALSQADFVCQPYTDATGSYVVTTAGAPYPTALFRVTADAVVTGASSFVGVAEVRVPPDATGVALCGKDVALLRLATSITGVGLVVPRLDLPSSVGEVFTASGFGATDAAGDGTGQRRDRDGLMVQVIGQGLVRDGATNVEVTTAEELVGDTGTCQGDSGSPALDALGQLFGVLSRGNAAACDGPVYTQVAAYADWLRAEGALAAAAAGEPAQPWVTAPVPGSANQGDDCVSDAQCADATVCLVVGARRRCTTTDCSACPAGWTCGTASAMAACVPDPSAMPDAGGSDAATHPAMHSGCGVGATGRGGAGALIAGLLAAMAASRRRRS